jgi:hypothetical protein
MSEHGQNEDLVRLLSEIIDGKLDYLMTNSSINYRRKEPGETDFLSGNPRPKNVTALQKKQNMRAIIEKKFRQKYKNS